MKSDIALVSFWITVAWAAMAEAAIALGKLFRHLKLPRLLGGALFLIATAKLLLIDMSGIDFIWRLLTAGGVLVVILAYRRYAAW